PDPLLRRLAVDAARDRMRICSPFIPALSGRGVGSSRTRRRVREPAATRARPFPLRTRRPPMASDRTLRTRGRLSLHRAALAAPVLLACVVALASARPARAGSDQWDDAVFCSDWYAKHPAVTLDLDKQRRCLIAIASTYLDGEEGSIAPEDIL